MSKKETTGEKLKVKGQNAACKATCPKKLCAKLKAPTPGNKSIETKMQKVTGNYHIFTNVFGVVAGIVAFPVDQA
jgi:hypothetical protein